MGAVLTDRTRAFLKIAVFLLIVILGNLLTHWFLDRLDFRLSPATEPMVHRIIILSMAAYTVLVAIPFVPGVEIGVAVLMILGPKISGLVYASTLAALVLSFMVGRFIPERVLVRFLRDLHFSKTSRLLAELNGLDSQQRLNLMIERSPRKLFPVLLRYRHIALIVAINMPGNMVIGGGGGIALMAGLSRIFTPGKFVLTTAIAIAPVPLAWYLFGHNISELPF